MPRVSRCTLRTVDLGLRTVDFLFFPLLPFPFLRLFHFLHQGFHLVAGKFVLCHNFSIVVFVDGLYFDGFGQVRFDFGEDWFFLGAAKRDSASFLFATSGAAHTVDVATGATGADPGSYDSIRRSLAHQAKPVSISVMPICSKLRFSSRSPSPWPCGRAWRT